MDYQLAMFEINPNITFNPDCFKYSEEVAREKKLWRDERPMPTIEMLNEALVQADKKISISQKYDEMVKDVYDQMELVFGTRNDVSASAFAATYEAMLKRPANYISAELNLNTEAEVTAYAQSKIASSDAYGVYRMKRIAQFTAEKQAIENG